MSEPTTDTETEVDHDASNALLQKAFNDAARTRLSEPMVTSEPRDESTLDGGNASTVPPMTGFELFLMSKYGTQYGTGELEQQKADWVTYVEARTEAGDTSALDEPSPFDLLERIQIIDALNRDDDEFDDAPGDFESDVLGRLEDLESTLGMIVESQTATKDAMEHIVAVVNKISEELEPTIKLITDSKVFRMMFPARKEVKP